MLPDVAFGLGPNVSSMSFLTSGELGLPAASLVALSSDDEPPPQPASATASTTGTTLKTVLMRNVPPLGHPSPAASEFTARVVGARYPSGNSNIRAKATATRSRT